MLKCLSGLTASQLNYYLSRVREIAAHEDTAALIETDKLLWEMLELLRVEQLDEDQEYEYINAPADTNSYFTNTDYRKQSARDAIQRLNDRIQSNNVKFYDIESLHHYVKRLHDAQQSDVSLYDAELDSIKAEAHALILSAEAVIFNKILEDSLNGTLKNINSVYAMDEGIKYALKRFIQYHELTPEIASKVRRAKERGANFRSDRKLANAQVAEEAGFSGKAAGLRREAAALLAQDWATVFPDEPSPTS